MSETLERPTDRSGTPALWHLALVFFAALGCFATLLFVPAGRLDWIAGWLYLALLAANMVVNYAILRRWNPELIGQRMRIAKGTVRWDKVWGACFAPIFIAIYVVAGLDAGRSAGASTPWGLWTAGLALFLPGNALFTWSMVVNPFFEKTVRIQTERGHRVVDTGPYGFVRHPGYLGFFSWGLSAPLLLGSPWATVPSLLSIVGIVVRTALEDRTLRAELPGYAEYTQRVRFRLVPGVW